MRYYYLILNFIVGITFYTELFLFTNQTLPSTSVAILAFFISSGTLIDTASSLLLEPLFKKLQIQKFRGYHVYVERSKADPTIADLNAQRVFYRNLTGSLFAVFFFVPERPESIVLIALSGLTILRMRKFSNYVQKRLMGEST